MVGSAVGDAVGIVFGNFVGFTVGSQEGVKVSGDADGSVLGAGVTEDAQEPIVTEAATYMSCHALLSSMN